MTRLLLIVFAVLLHGCSPFFAFKPPAFTSKAFLQMAQKNEGHEASLHIAIDSYGIPFIKGKSIDALMYGLGFMHARDRLFQIDLMRHAALGRLGELFGDLGLNFDRKLRILTYKLEDQEERLSKEEHVLLEHYVRGVNDGAQFRGRTAEHFLLGAQFEPFTKRDAIAIARLQSWQLAADFFAELTRLKIARSDWSLAQKMEVMGPIDDLGASIITDYTKGSIPRKYGLPPYLKDKRASSHNATKKEDFLESFLGASNAWAIRGDKTLDGHAIVMNDPHLQHAWPSNFYLATLCTDGFFASGASLPGLPGIIIGSTKTLAWGVTAAFINTQDAVLLAMDPHDDKTYVVEREKRKLEQWPQRFCLNKKNKCIEEIYYLSVFGPVLTHEFDHWVSKGDVVAMQWTGFHTDQHSLISAGFTNLAKAKSVTEGIEAVKSMTLPGVNLVLADTLGHIGYAYAGLVPKRDPSQNSFLPLDGRTLNSRWSGFLKPSLKPSEINPRSGFLVTANQSIFGRNAGAYTDFGKVGAPPFRALRIKERIEDMLIKDGKVDFLQLASIQLDDTSLEAKEIAPLLGRRCQEHFDKTDKKRQAFAKVIAEFNGRYTTNSLGALPYDILMKELVSLRLESAIGKTIPDYITYTGQLIYLVKSSLLQELSGKATIIFEKPLDGFADFNQFIGKACDQGFQKLVKMAGSSPGFWRYGRYHYLQRRSPLAKAPFIGGSFRDKKREIAGTSNAPLAEVGYPVTNGANLRFRVRLTNPPQIEAALDSGNGGTIGGEHAFDQIPLWQQGRTILLETDWAKALKASSVNFKLNP